MEGNLDFHGASNDSDFGKPIFTLNSGNLTHCHNSFDCIINHSDPTLFSHIKYLRNENKKQSEITSDNLQPTA
ncbi:CLUMA_CG002442, isoform A [Clunio marinus]|uniref:CLUMA_CG002442, isoform A n=1 Tax=Clunio marinus TaxID=568069 RepID=A0A1J1HR00_9DIPT|nr:CLUMA_CG002442, isoform A [Clunio marinus]